MTKTPVQMLADLNALRVAKGLKPLKAWKDSKVKLAEALAKMGGKIEATVILSHPGMPDLELGTRTLTPGEVASAEKAPHRLNGTKLPRIAASTGLPAKGNNKYTAKAKPAAGKRGVRTLEAGEVHLTSIATAAKISPKNARAIARRNKSAIAKLQVSGKKYVFTKANAAAVRTILETVEEK